MAKLIYTAITSLDGYVADVNGSFAWAGPDEEVHAFVNDLERPNGTYLYGRRMYEVMVFWETALARADLSAAVRDYATIWRSAEKIVYSTTLAQPVTDHTRIERSFEPYLIDGLKKSATRDVSIGGPGLAGRALGAGLVDELRLFASPVIVGGGNRWLPDGVRLELELLDERRFGSGVVYSSYRVGCS